MKDPGPEFSGLDQNLKFHKFSRTKTPLFMIMLSIKIQKYPFYDFSRHDSELEVLNSLSINPIIALLNKRAMNK